MRRISMEGLCPVGATVVLDYMDDIQAPAPGTKGKVAFVDDIGNIHVN